jgi:hypothetical protein
MVTVTLVGPDEGRSSVTISDDATVRDVAATKYPLFWRYLRKNGNAVPFTAKVRNGDIVTVEDEPVDEI